MKRIMLAALLALTAMPAVYAQGPGRFGRDGGTPPTAEQMVERRVARLTTLLTLDAAQQQQAKTIFTDEMTASQALIDKVRAAHEALQTAVKGSAADAQIDQLAAAVGTLQGQQAAIHAKAQSKFRAILTSAQKEKLDSVEPDGRMGPGGGRAPFRGPGFAQ